VADLLHTHKRLIFLLLFCLGLDSYASAQIHFIENKGQWDNAVSFSANVNGGKLWLNNNKELRYSFLSPRKSAHKPHPIPGDSAFIHNIFMTWEDANLKSFITTQSEFTTQYYNYYKGVSIGNKATKLYGIHNLMVKELYKGIDLELNTHSGSALEYIYHVSPRINPNKIKLKISGANQVILAPNGSFAINHTLGVINVDKPKAWTINEQGEKVEVAIVYKLENNTLSFSIGKYNKDLSLVIDPTLIFASYSGSIADNFGFTATYDDKGNAYSGGTVYDVGYPVTAGAIQSKFAGGESVNGSIGDIERDAAILKFSSDGTKLLWATYLGGSHNEQPHSMVVNNNSDLLVMGTTESKDFPKAPGYDTSLNGKSDIFVVKISSDGTKLLGSTLIGGSGYDGLNGTILFGVRNPSPLGYNYGDSYRGEVICDTITGQIYIASTTYSTDWPTTTGCYQSSYGGNQDGIIASFSSDLKQLYWSTYFGGTLSDAAFGLNLDANKNLYITGGTHSSGLVPNGLKAYQSTFQGDSADGFIIHLTGNGTTLSHATYVGTAKYDQSYFVQLDKQGSVYVYGQTESDFWPITKVNYFNNKGKQFITKFKPNLDTLLLSTVFGSGRKEPDISPAAFLVDRCDKVYVSGWGGGTNDQPLGHGGSTNNLPLTNDAFQNFTDGSDFWVGVFSRDIDTLLYASYFGGQLSEEHVDGGTSRFDRKGVVYQSVCGGCGGNSDFPITKNAHSPKNLSKNCNNLVFKVDLNIVELKADLTIPPAGCNPLTISPINKSIKATSYLWIWGDGTQTAAYQPTHTYTKNGIYTVKLVAYNKNSCSGSDTAVKPINSYLTSKASFKYEQKNCSRLIKFTSTGVATTYNWEFGDSTFASTTTDTVNHRFLYDGAFKVRLITDRNTPCQAKDSLTVNLNLPTSFVTFTFEPCNRILNLINTANKSGKTIWSFDGITIPDTGSRVSYIVNTFIDSVFVQAISITNKGCTDTFKQYFKAPRPISPKFTYAYDTCSNTITFQNLSTGGNGFSWDFGDSTVAFNKNPVHKYSKNGNSKVIVKLVLIHPVCPKIYIDTIELSTKADPKIDFTNDTCTGEYKFKHLFPVKGKVIKWTFGDGGSSNDNEPSHIYANPGRYTIQLIDYRITTCPDTTTTAIDVKYGSKDIVILPNVFTPNGDGINDVFEATAGARECKYYLLEIYNRWGERAHYQEGNNFSWNGINPRNGSEFPDGIYYFVLTYSDKRKQTGTVSLIR